MPQSTKNAGTIASTTQLTEAELAVISGGIWDNKWEDAANKRIADQNKGQGTLGGSLGDPYVHGQPIF